MATMTTTSAVMNSPFRQLSREYVHITLRSPLLSVRFCHDAACSTIINKGCYWSSHRGNLRSLVSPICAIGSGLEASITDPKENAISVKNAKIVAKSQDDKRIQVNKGLNSTYLAKRMLHLVDHLGLSTLHIYRVRVDLNGEDTRVVFDKVLTNLARTAPPVPGFRRQKGGKTSKVPKDFLLQMLGEERVTNFVIQEIVSSTLANYAEKENLNVKDNKIKTIETADELRSSFKPGNEFGFNAILELEETVAETSSSSGALITES